MVRKQAKSKEYLVAATVLKTVGRVDAGAASANSRGTPMRLMKSALVLTVLACGCASAPLLGNLRRQAASDLDCPEPEVSTAELGNFSVQAAWGCQHKATYALENGNWMLRSRDNVTVDSLSADDAKVPDSK